MTIMMQEVPPVRWLYGDQCFLIHNYNCTKFTGSMWVVVDYYFRGSNIALSLNTYFHAMLTFSITQMTAIITAFPPSRNTRGTHLA